MGKIKNLRSQKHSISYGYGDWLNILENCKFANKLDFEKYIVLGSSVSTSISIFSNWQ